MCIVSLLAQIISDFLFQGLQEKEILLHLEVDNEPKINQEYRIQLFNLRTEGEG